MIAVAELETSPAWAAVHQAHLGARSGRHRGDYRKGAALATFLDEAMSEEFVTACGDTFVCARAIRLLALQDMACGSMRSSEGPVTLATIRGFGTRFGAPVTLDPEEPGWDFRLRPGSSPDAIPADSPFLEVFARMDASLTRHAAALGSAEWQAAAGCLAGFPEPEPTGSLDHLFPHPYTPFLEADGGKVCDWATLAFRERAYPLALRYAFLKDLAAGFPVHAPCAGRLGARTRSGDALGTVEIAVLVRGGAAVAMRVLRDFREERTVVKEGSLVGHEAPLIGNKELRRDLSRLNRQEVVNRIWAYLPELFGTQARFEEIVRFRFARWARSLVPGRLYWPSEVVAAASLWAAPDEDPWFDVTAMLASCYDLESHTALLPPARLHRWDEFELVLGRGEIRADLTPRDLRFRGCPPLQGRVSCMSSRSTAAVI